MANIIIFGTSLRNLGSNKLGHDLGRGSAGLDALDGVRIGLCLEDGGSCDEGVCSSLNHLVGVVGGDSSIDLNPRVDSPLIAHAFELPDLLDLALDELLASKARVDALRESGGVGVRRREENKIKKFVIRGGKEEDMEIVMGEDRRDCCGW